MNPESVNRPIISIRGLSFSYGAAQVLEGVTFDVPHGGMILLKGPSGGGKSTLLRLLSQVEQHQEGEFLFAGRDIESIPVERYRTLAGYLHQKPVIAPGSVFDNLMLAFRFRQDAPAPPGDDELRALLDRLELRDVPLSQPASELSVGQQQRVAFLRLVLLRPRVMLLDEPLASLDDRSAACVMQWLSELNSADGTTVLLSAHGAHAPSFAGSGVLRVERNTAWMES